MSCALAYPISEIAARDLIREAMVITAEANTVAMPWGHFVLREDIPQDELTGCVAVLGAFDGFHIGHAELVREALEDAAGIGTHCVALTLWPDPSEVLGRPEGRLMDARQRVDALLEAGVSAVAVLSFDEELAALSPAAFVGELMNLLAPCAVHVGENFRFGFRGEGTAKTLVELCGVDGVKVSVRETLEADGAPVSATRVRGLVEAGRLDDAANLMGRYLCLTGTVAHGRGEGTGFGFATANLEIEKERVLLSPGVYAGYTVIDGYAWPTAANAGSPLSFGGGEDNLIEAHLLGFSETVYGKVASFVPLCKLRGEQRFSSREELVDTVMGNIDWVAHNLGTQGLGV